MTWPNVHASGGVKTSSPANEVHPGGKSPLFWMRPKYRSIILIVDSIFSSADAPLLFMFNPGICKTYAASQIGWSFSPILPVENWVQPLGRKKHSHEVNQVTLMTYIVGGWKNMLAQVKLDHFPTKWRWGSTTTRYLARSTRVNPNWAVLNGEWQDRLISTSSLGGVFCCFGRVGWRVMARFQREVKKTCNAETNSSPLKVQGLKRVIVLESSRRRCFVITCPGN